MEACDRQRGPGMGLAAKLYNDDRIADRQTVNLDATMRGDDQCPVDILIEDLSTSGFGMTGGAVAVDAIVSVGIAGIGRRQARVVRREGTRAGCEFLQPISAADLAAAQTTETIVAADFGRLPIYVEDTPPLDSFERAVRRIRGPIILAGLVLPWFAIASLIRPWLS